jgi:hypothetical protein
MKTILGLGRHYYLVKVSIFLIMAALIVVIVGCASVDYFPIKEGRGILYHVTDSYDDLDCNVWVVSQYYETGKPDDLDFVFTLIKEGTTGGFYAPSSLGGQTSLPSGDKLLTAFNNGDPASNQGKFYMNFQLPSTFNIDDTWTFGTRIYKVYTIGAQKLQNEDLFYGVKVTVDDLSNPDPYLKGSGYFILADGIGIVELVFNRADGTNVLYEYVSRTKLVKHTISGTVNDNGVPVSGIIVAISDAKWGTYSETDSNGAFSIQAYGPDVVLRIWYDKNPQDDVCDSDDPNYPKQYCVHGDTNHGGLIIDISQPSNCS